MAKEKREEGAQFVRYFGPLLDALRNLGGSAKADEAVDRVAQDLEIADEVLNETLPSGGSRFRNQVAWARFYLVRDGLVDSSKHGGVSLTRVSKRPSHPSRRERCFSNGSRFSRLSGSRRRKPSLWPNRLPRGPDRSRKTTERRAWSTARLAPGRFRTSFPEAFA